jgi:membrane associated rhomboid family serine protease
VTTLIIFFFITVIEVPAGVILAIWFVLQLFSGVGQLASEVNGGGVAYWAHVGGFAFGALVAWLFYRNRRRPRPTVSGAPRWPGDPG